MKRFSFILAALASTVLLINEVDSFGGKSIKIWTDNGPLCGTIEMPKGSNFCPMALMISGSGPTDRDGNNPITGKNNSLKLLAESLASNGIGSLRFDKRGIGESAKAGCKEEYLRFETYINDAVLWCEKIRKNPRLSKLLIIGHSEGSLIGMVACRKAKADGFVSIGGTAYPASELILNQLKAKLSDELYRQSETIVEQLKRGIITDRIPTELNALLRPSVQPYLISWLKYNPVRELPQLKIPILIIQGSTDIQVSANNAKILAKANESAEVVIIEGMNHILKEITGDLQRQIKSYADPSLPIASELIEQIVGFAKGL